MTLPTSFSKEKAILNLQCLCVIFALFIAFPAFAHHGSSGQFDTNATVEFSGNITRVRLVNPHAYVYFDSIDEAGKVTNKRCELQSGSLLKRRGWTQSLFKTGSFISIKGSPDRTDPTTCYMKEITFENGVVAFRNSEFDENGNVLVTSEGALDGEPSKEHHAEEHEEDFHHDDEHHDEDDHLNTASLEQTVDLSSRERLHEDGSLNMAGNWVMVRSGEGPPGGGGSRAMLTPAGQKAVEGATSADNPRYQCKPTNIIMDWWFDMMVNHIEQTDKRITLTYGFMNLKRTIYLDGTTMPANYQPNRAGFSTGKWEGDELVVTTTGFDEGWIMAPLGGNPGGPPPGQERAKRPPRPSGEQGMPRAGTRGPEGRPGPPSPAKNSAQMTIVERFTLSEDGTVLSRKYTITDPLYLASPMEGQDEVTFTNDKYIDYECEDLTAERGSDSLGGVGVTRATKNNIESDDVAKGFLYSLEDSTIGTTISSTQWGYPIVLSLHAIGMAIMVGVSLMLCARVIGFASTIPLSSFAPYWSIGLIGLVINFLSGTALFFGNASELYFNLAFRIKIGLVVLGLVLTKMMVKRAIISGNDSGKGHKPLAIATLLCWVAAIIAGRLIGYMS
ncbi:DUF6152 family protein [Alteromonas sp. PRIM-21]|uniref:DUF6152 family protein n=1 Tax=Alteromonas sp. PRIM-21 TaxID=1454978 RepID=UPI0022B9ACD5|nr:DUF6152 family protein [Alteromonas sp. PRIM-21]MCZ8528803.1 hypothetical protein [Alteromonas sp. PRIM-21]